MSTRFYPFRHELRTAASQETQRSEQGDAQAIIERIFSGYPEVTTLDIAGWLQHPDERVLLAVVDSYPAIVSTTLRVLLKERVQRIMEEDGQIGWSPVLDRIARLIDIDTQAREKALAPWLRAASAEEVLKALRPFKGELLFWIAAKHVRSWSPELVGMVLHRSLRAAARLGRNRYLNEPSSVESLFDHLMQVAESVGGDNLPVGVAAGIQGLFRRWEYLPSDAIERSLRVVASGPRRVAGAFARALGSMPTFDDALGHRILDLMGGRWEIAAGLVKGGRCSVAIAKRALELAPRLQVRRAVAKRPNLLHDPEIRAELKRSKCARIARALIRTAKPDEVSNILDKLSRTNIVRVLDLLEDGVPEGTTVSVDTMEELLSSPYSYTRERAIRVLSRVNLRTKAEDAEAASEEGALPSRSRRGR